MPEPILFVTVAEVAEWLDLDAANLTPRQTNIIKRRIVAAQNRVADYLHRPLTPSTVVLSELWQDERYPTSEPEAWPQAGPLLDDVYRVVSATPGPDGTTWDVTFSVGLDVANDDRLSSIKDFVLEDVIEYLTNSPFFKEIKRQVKSVSAEGQSVSYVGRAQSPDAAGAGTTLNDLRRWRRYSVGRAPTTHDTRPFPYRQ